MENINLNNEQLDALKEIGNIGAGNAAIALSQLLNKKVMINVPRVSLISRDKISESEFMIAPDEVSIAVSLKILGALKGGMLVLFSQKSALLMIDVLLQRKAGTTQFLTTVDTSAISESSHILSSSYLNAVGELLMIYRLTPLISQVAIDKMKRLNELLIKSFIEPSDAYILPIENHLIIEDKEVDLFVTFLLEHESVKQILSIVGL